VVRRIILAICLCLFTSTSALAVEVGSIVIPDQLSILHGKIQSSLSLRGAGVRKKFVYELYVAGLYVNIANKKISAKQLSNGDEDMAIKLHILSEMVTSKRMLKSTRDGFNKSIGSNWGDLSDTIIDFMDVFQGGISVNDIYDLIYVKGEGTKIYKNGKLEKNIPGLKFKAALFGIWLSENPVQKSLKIKLLNY